MCITVANCCVSAGDTSQAWNRSLRMCVGETASSPENDPLQWRIKTPDDLPRRKLVASQKTTDNTDHSLTARLFSYIWTQVLPPLLGKSVLSLALPFAQKA